MGSRGRLVFDLNEPPAEDDEGTDHVVCLQPHKALPSANPHHSDLFVASMDPKGLNNNHAFSHASSVSGFQPFVRPKVAYGPEMGFEKKMAEEQNPKFASPAKTITDDDKKEAPSLVSGSADIKAVEREEGEWSDAEGSADACAGSSMCEQGKASQDQVKSELEGCTSGAVSMNVSSSVKVIDNANAESSGHVSPGLDQGQNDHKSNNSRNSNGNANGDVSTDGQEEIASVSKQCDVRGMEASHALKSSNNLGKRKIDQHKEAMLGKKRNRQTMLINIDEAKQAGSMKSSTPRRQPTVTRSVKEVHNGPPPAERVGERPSHPIIKDQKQADLLCNGGGNSVESCLPKSECTGNVNSVQPAKNRKVNGDSDFSVDSPLPPLPKQNSWRQPAESSWKHPADLRQPKNSQFSNRKPALTSQSSMDSKLGNKKYLPVKKPTVASTPYQDTSVERLIREVTNEKFWHHPGIKQNIYIHSCIWLYALSVSVWFLGQRDRT
jgi:senataxin